MTEKIIEKVQVPHPTRKTGVVTCIRLLSPSEGEGAIVTEGKYGHDIFFINILLTYIIIGDAPLDVAESCNSTKLKANVSIHKQIIDIIDRAGPEGITLTVSALSYWSHLMVSNCMTFRNCQKYCAISIDESSSYFSHGSKERLLQPILVTLLSLHLKKPTAANVVSGTIL